MGKFVILLERETTDEISSFSEFMRSSGYGWWHRTPNSWIISTKDGLTNMQLRDIAAIYFPQRKIIVLGLDGFWNGWGVPSDFEWFRNTNNW